MCFISKDNKHIDGSVQYEMWKKKEKEKKKIFFKGLFLGKVCADPLGGKAKQTLTGEMR